MSRSRAGQGLEDVMTAKSVRRLSDHTGFFWPVILTETASASSIGHHSHRLQRTGTYRLLCCLPTLRAAKDGGRRRCHVGARLGDGLPHR